MNTNRMRREVEALIADVGMNIEAVRQAKHFVYRLRRPDGEVRCLTVSVSPGGDNLRKVKRDLERMSTKG